MDSLTHPQITSLFLALGTLLASATALGEIARRCSQPAVLGEIVAGILLGPTILGEIAPGIEHFLFPSHGVNAVVLDGVTTMAIVLFLLVAGTEVNISSIWRQGKAVLTIGIAGIIVPFVLGFMTAECFYDVLGRGGQVNPRIFSFFFATALSISALPVIAKTLMDLNLYRSDLGMISIAAAILNDLVGWIIFAVILGMMGVGSHLDSGGAARTIGLTIGFAIFSVTVLRWLFHRILPWVQAHWSWPGGVLGFTLSLTFLCAAWTEWIGVHAIFGSFLMGVALGDTPHFRYRIRVVIEQFVTYVFAPLFFAGIGLKVNFITHFDLGLVSTVLLIACLGKIIGCWSGGKIAGLSDRESWALGFSMNARGAMEIILGLVALRFGVIGEPMFVALVIMALATSVMSGPLMSSILRLKSPYRLGKFLTAKAFLSLESAGREGAIRELAQSLARSAEVEVEAVIRETLNREKLTSTGLGNGVAAPHCRLRTVDRPLVAVGLSSMGIDFEAPDGKAAHVVFLIVTPRKDSGAQLEIVAEIARLFKSPTLLEKCLRTNGNFTNFLALLNTRMRS